MEELSLITNPSSSRKSSLLSSSTNEESVSIPVSEKKENLIKKNPIKKLTFNKKLEESEEIKKLKQKHLKHYTTKEIIQRSIKFSLKNWRYNIYTQVQRIIDETCSMILPVYHANIINAITQEKNYNLLKSTTTKYLLLLFFKFLFGELMQVFAYFFIRDSLYEYKNIVLENIAEKDIEFFDIFKTGEVLERIKNSESTLEQNYIFETLNFIQQICKFFFFLYYLFNYNFQLSVISLIIYTIKFLGDHFIRKKSDFFNRKNRMSIHDNYNNALNEFVTNIRLIKSFGMEFFEVEKMQELKLKVSRPFGSKDNFLLKMLMFVNQFGDTIILFIAGKKTLNGEMSYGDLSLFQNYFRQLQMTFNKIQTEYQNYQDFFENWKRFFEVYDYQPKIVNNDVNIKPDEIEGKITFNNVTFGYPLKPEVKILHNLNFSIEPGKVFAIVGFSGSGKSTISNLLLRFYDVNSGEILIDNNNIKDFNILHYHQKLISLVQQEPILNSGTIEENILYGIKEYSQEYFDEICELSNLNFIKDKSLFPDGFKTLVGERGTKVSGGQKQRIAIARALMKNSKILIFDEATSALDAESENEVQKAIDNIVKNKKITTLIIAHRLSTIKNADVILFLNKGKIVEMGTHDELIEKNGEYKKLVQRQLVNYESNKEKKQKKNDEKNDDKKNDDDKNDDKKNDDNNEDVKEEKKFKRKKSKKHKENEDEKESLI